MQPRAAGDRRSMIVVGAVVAVLAWGVLGRPGTPAGRPAATPDVPVVVDAAPVAETPEGVALRVLHTWDRRRARAWARQDAAALGSLYAPGSVAGARDAAMLGAWAERGVRVRGLRIQLLGIEVRQHGPRRLVVVVTDRVVRGRGVGPGGVVRLPRDRESTRRLVLVRPAGRWLLAGAYDVPARPVASTSSTEGSRSS
ncbi:hypothetical protein E8D34_19625 [Nocardioides sp. GY 10113]|uniref:hypothetical protein n=1 Tax=Nocardioides sp. GY 10113 TaxID=2569761 RepID=UPI0010A8A395|nr:hypothetical protein [Nocardioides sp. GY 10113]TIC79881.1 hypothetical protein E8D34_19625 [Nocardioides sp. GY 10113]